MVLRVQMPLRLEVEIAQKLKEQAIKENRSVNNLIETIIKQYISEQDKKEKEP